MNAATRSMCDISPLLFFCFWQPVYFIHDDSDFPSESTEERGRFVGISESVRHQMTFKILSNKSSKIIHYSNVQPTNDPFIRLEPLIILAIVKYKCEMHDEKL